MAAQLSIIDVLNFHSLTGMANYRAVFRVENVEPSEATQNNELPLDLGDLDRDLPNIQYRFKLNVGRLGHPGAEVIIILPEIGGTSRKELSFAIESGVHARAASNNSYHLHTLEAQFQGRPGGGGNTNRGDVASLLTQSVSRKKRILKVRLTALGVVPFPDTFTVNDVLTDNRTPEVARRLIQILRDATSVDLRVYFLFGEDTQDRVTREVLHPFQSVMGLRLPPLYQYTYPTNQLTLDMESYRDFQNGMYCSPRRDDPNRLSDPHRVLPGTQSRRDPRTVAIAHAVGHIREFQGQERIAGQLRSRQQALRVVRTPWPILDAHTRSLIQNGATIPSPADEQCFVAYVGNGAKLSETRDTPLPGIIFKVMWQNNAFAYGVVLDIPEAFLQTANASFVMGLLGLPRNVKNGASAKRDLATAAPAILTIESNRHIWQVQLDSMQKLSRTSPQLHIRSIQDAVVYQPQMMSEATDRRHDGNAWFAALPEVASHLLNNVQLSNRERQLLNDKIRLSTSPVQLIRTHLEDVRFRSVLAVACLYLLVGLPVVLVANASEDRASISRHVRAMLVHGAKAPHNGQTWASKASLVYTSNELNPVDDPAEANTRMAIDLTTRFVVDDFPHHMWHTEESASHYSSATKSCPPDGVPLDMSMGHGIQSMLSAVPQAERHQYYLDRQQLVDGTFPLNTARLNATRDRRNALETQAILRTNLIVTNYTTAMSDKIRLEKKNAVLIFTDAHTVQLTPLVTVMHRYPGSPMVFVCGDPNDARHPLRLSSRGQNEASATTDWSAWEVMERAGGMPHSLE